ncbi:hypothetical protein [Streptomyces pinistramenti]|uniref:hypothetical protein n=1 Tax=Streptomyces pinistramenti TaxID=2884812 RepID=UPI001D0903F2|nr:hypothetical protein [Streptomyces pinistramenti]MCB5911965.1 hypothetical protein [Streptomyces pinistramenti]
MSQGTNSVMATDHLAWLAGGSHIRLVRSGAGLWRASAGVGGLDLACVAGTEDSKPMVITTDTSDLPASVPAALREPLQRKLGVVHRLANPWLWDALTAAILRRVVRPPQARFLYRRWCLKHGTTLDSVYGNPAVVPGPERVLELTDAEFVTAGAKLHRKALQAAATAYLADAEVWASLEANKLVTALTSIHGVGPWSASAAAADFTGDYSVYPHADVAVRSWAHIIAPHEPWPDSDKKFEERWLRLAGPGSGAVHTLTLTTLTWGSHALLPTKK